MRILVTRSRITGTVPFFEYRVFIPFPEISAERHALIHYRTDFGQGQGDMARIPEVIAPMAFLELAPGLRKLEAGRRIDAVAQHVTAVIVQAVYPEMTAEPVPILQLVGEDPPPAVTTVELMYLAGAYERLLELGRVTPDDLDLRIADPARVDA